MAPKKKAPATVDSAGSRKGKGKSKSDAGSSPIQSTSREDRDDSTLQNNDVRKKLLELSECLASTVQALGVAGRSSRSASVVSRGSVASRQHSRHSSSSTLSAVSSTDREKEKKSKHKRHSSKGKRSHRHKGKKSKRRRHSSSSSSETSTDTSQTTTDSVLDTRTEVTNLLVDTAPRKPKKKGTVACLPYNFVTRGDKRTVVGPGEASWQEHFLALKTMVRDASCPADWAPFIRVHEEQLVRLALIFDWPTCRKWSEELFFQINAKSIPNGWENLVAIKDLERDITAGGKRIAKDFHNKPDGYKKSQNTTPAASNASQYTQRSQEAKPAFAPDRDGKPCYAWNWGRDCGNYGSHGQLPDLALHACAWCAYKFKKVNFHREKECVNKVRFGQKTQGGANSNETQDFR